MRAAQIALFQKDADEKGRAESRLEQLLERSALQGQRFLDIDEFRLGDLRAVRSRTPPWLPGGHLLGRDDHHLERRADLQRRRPSIELLLRHAKRGLQRVRGRIQPRIGILQ